jgi:putative transposase
MRRKLTRYYGAGDLHFITCSCYRRQPWLGSARRRDLLLAVLEGVRRRYQFVVAGYVFMPEHIHLLIGEPQKANTTPSTVIQALKLGYARRMLAQARRRQSSGQAALFDTTPQHVWQKRFYDFNVWTERKRIEKLRYMHQNPVKRGLAISPELWRWSSFRSYSLGETGAVRVNDWEVLKMKIRPQAP